MVVSVVSSRREKERLTLLARIKAIRIGVCAMMGRRGRRWLRLLTVCREVDVRRGGRVGEILGERKSGRGREALLESRTSRRSPRRLLKREASAGLVEVAAHTIVPMRRYVRKMLA